MDLQLLGKTLADRGEPRFRAARSGRGRQRARAAKGADGYEQVTDVPASLRETLTRELPFSSLVLRAQTRARDLTVKALFATADGHRLEAVLMRYRRRRQSGARAGARALQGAVAGAGAGASDLQGQLIPYNPTASDYGYHGSTPESIASFRAVLEGRGIPTTIGLPGGARSTRRAVSSRRAPARSS
jgi:adenine C2-methylase RlmN of 23S rRNA A2503 and tRNA A37